MASIRIPSIGDLRRSVSIERQVRTLNQYGDDLAIDDYGAPLRPSKVPEGESGWETLPGGESEWASIMPLSAIERDRMTAEVGEVTHRIYLRWRSDYGDGGDEELTIRNRIKDERLKVYHIVSIFNVGYRDRFTELLAREII